MDGGNLAADIYDLPHHPPLQVDPGPVDSWESPRARHPILPIHGAKPRENADGYGQKQGIRYRIHSGRSVGHIPKRQKLERILDPKPPMTLLQQAA